MRTPNAGSVPLRGAAGKLALRGGGCDVSAMSRGRLLLGAFVPGLALAGLVSLAGQDASAKVSFDSAYTHEQTYNAALRYVRVDLGFKVTERDPQAAYVMFDYKSSESGDRVSAGSVEVVPTGGVVKVVVQLAQMPRYHEQVIADGLQKKLRSEYGEPPKKAPPPAAPPDGGADGPGDGG